jgi:hypothetical protein
LGEEHRGCWGEKCPKKEKAIAGWTNLQKDELRSLYSNEIHYEYQNEKK